VVDIDTRLTGSVLAFARVRSILTRYMERSMFKARTWMQAWALGILSAGSVTAQTAKSPKSSMDSLQQADSALQPPAAARRGDGVDVYHGQSVKDPYRWMEDVRSPETRAWIEDQDRYARAFLARWAGRDAARAALARGNIPIVSRAPTKEGGRYFYTRSRNTGPGASFSGLMRIGHGQERVVINAESLWNAEKLRVRRITPAPDGILVAYGVGQGGSLSETIRIRNVDTGRDLVDRIEGVHGTSSLRWARGGNRGFFYTRFNPAERVGVGTGVPEHPRIYFHTIGTAQSDDKLVFERPDHPEWLLTHTVSDDGRYLLISARVGVERKDRIFYRDLTQVGSSVIPLIVEADAEFLFVGNLGHVLWFQTDHAAPQRRVIAIDLSNPVRAAWRELIPEGKNAIDTWTGGGVHAVGNRLLVNYREDAVLVTRVFDTEGHYVSTIRFPQRFNSMWSITGRQTDPEALYVLQGVADPGTVYSYDTRTGQSTVFERPVLAYDPLEFVTEQVFYSGKDGTRIPMYVVHHRNTRLDGTAPGMVYGYGFGAWSGSPWFQPMVTEFMREGGVWALANIRGGGEYGEPWAAAGRRRNKQTSVDDFVAAGEWLVAHKLVAPGRLIANSGSAGGVIAAAAIVQHPTLFAAGILDYPVIDMFRYHTFTGGVRWTKEYGTVADSADFAALRAYSPYHALRAGTCYPPVLISPGELDQTATPMHAYKFAAALQFANAGTPGCSSAELLRVSWGAGHMAGATADDSNENWADQLAFLAQVLGGKRGTPSSGSQVRR
jgi:prolyl oligopeptidase